ncbi:hypothetical protein WAI453_009496 [Rhynchosporium graminicola]
MKLILVSALFISSVRSAAINDTGLEARRIYTTCLCIVPVNDHNGFHLIDFVPRGRGYIPRNAPVFDDTLNRLQGYCNIGFERNDDCTKWRQTTTTTDGPCDGKIHTADCSIGR